MGNFVFTETEIKGVFLVESKKFSDKRGFFTEAYNEEDFKKAGLDFRFVQDNLSSSAKGVLRGLHFQKKHPQAKLVSVITGSVFDVAVDLRKGSETYGKWVGEMLTSDNCKQLLIPRGFAHGFLVLSDYAQFCYKCDDFYHPEDEGGIIWNDKTISVRWPVDLCKDLILSEKDLKLPSLVECNAEFCL